MQVHFLEPEQYRKFYTALVTDEKGRDHWFFFGINTPRERALKMLPVLLGDGRRRSRKKGTDIAVANHM
ncbi:hypothetical protein P4S95_08260 [Aneurinibacillus aneurinilyticus]|uniref:hypothetical protein n=1 Tax=Aneurinibacillus aneurinilyticus TaxID=1391 RepID=UPI002E202EBF|nr:hypothetical protein [Aneurinibacillus aneurinilyticus]